MLDVVVGAGLKTWCVTQFPPRKAREKGVSHQEGKQQQQKATARNDEE